MDIGPLEEIVIAEPDLIPVEPDQDIPAPVEPEPAEVGHG